MAFIPSSGSVVAFQSDPTKLVGTVSVVGTLPVVLNNSSIITVQQGSIAAVIIGGSIAANFTPPANQSVSGAVSISNFPTTQNVSGSVVGFQGTNPWTVTSSIAGGIFPISGSVAATIVGTPNVNVAGSVATVIIGGSIAASFTPPVNQSVSGTVQTQVQASVAVVIIGGSILTSSTANQSVSGTVGASIIGTVPVTQTTSPWVVNYQNSSIIAVSTGSVVAIPTGNQSISGTVTVGSMLAMPAIISTANSTTAPVTSTLSFTGTGEEWKDFGTITVNVFTDAVSATNGLSIQQSSDNSNWDITDTYTIPSMLAGQGKTYGLQPAARFGRIVYTQGAQNSGAFRLQTIYHPQYTKPSSQRPSDGYTNETDLEQSQGFGMVYDDTSNTWYRMRGRSSLGTLVYTTSSIVALVTGTPSISGTVGASIIGQLPAGTAMLGSVVAYQGAIPWTIGSVYGNISGSVAATITNTNVNVSGSVVAFQGAGWSGSVAATIVGQPITVTPNFSSVITVFSSPSIVGTYADDSPSATGDKGIFVLAVRNDTMSSVESNDGDYSEFAVGPVGETLVANSPITKWVYGTTSIVSGASVALIAAGGASIFTYVTGLNVVNPSANNFYGTLSTGAGAASVLAYFVAPANGGSNMVFPNPLRSRDNTAILASISGVGSVFLSAQGFTSKT